MNPDGLEQLSMMGNTNNLILTNDWFAKCGKNVEQIIPNVLWSVYIPIVFGAPSPWTESSQCLADFRITGLRSLVHATQYMFLATAMSEKGTPHIRVNRQTNRSFYDQVVRAYCCYKQGHEKQIHEPIVKAWVSYNHYFDPVVADDIKTTMAQVVIEKARGGRRGGAGGGVNDHGPVVPQVVQMPPIPETNAEMDAWAQDARRWMQENNIDEADLPDRAAQVLQQFRDMSPAERWIRDYLLPHAIDVNESLDLFEHDACATEVMQRCRLQHCMWPLTRNGIMEPEMAAAAAQPQQPRDVVQDANIRPKVFTTFFRVTSKFCMFRFSVLDPNFTMMDVESALLQYAGPDMVKLVTGKQASGTLYGRPQDPFKDLRFLGDQHIVNVKFTHRNYQEMVSKFFEISNDKVNWDMANVGNLFNDISHPLHISSCCTLERAIALFKTFSPDNPGVRDVVDGFYAKLQVSERRKETGYAEGFEWYTFHPDQCFWTHRQYLGIAFTRWPFLTTKENFAGDVLSKKIVIVNGKLTAPPAAAGGAASTPLEVLASNQVRTYLNPVVDKVEYKKNMPAVLNYQTGDQLMIWEKETVEATKQIDQLLPQNPELEPERYAEYCEARRRMRESGLDKFCSVFVIDGVTQNKPIAGSIKACAKRLSEIVARNVERTVTCHLPYFDNQMTVWGNAAIRRMLITSAGKTIINAKLPFHAAALNSTFDLTRPGQPKMHIQLCGPAEAGKTFPLLGFIKNNYVEGTWVEIHSKSSRADNTDTHIGPRIGLCDEPPKYVTRKEAEDANYEQVQEMKDALVNHRHSRSVLEYAELNGQSVRISRNIITDDATTWAYCTNQPRDKNHPLGTRMFQVTVPLPAKPPEEYQYNPGAAFSQDVTVFFNIDQILAVSVYTSIRCGVIPDIDMEMPRTVMKQIYKLLREWNVIDQKKGNRSLQIIEAYIRHQIIIRGIEATYHLPGGPLYMRPYDPADVHMVGPRLCPTLEIIFASIHLMASEIIDEEVPIVWKALAARAKYDLTKTALENAHCNFKREFLRSPAPAQRGRREAQQVVADSGDSHKINFNYLEFQGTLEQIAAQLEHYCKPSLSAAQIADVIRSNINRQVHAKDGKCYKSVLESQWDHYKNRQPLIDSSNGATITPDMFPEWVMEEQQFISACEYNPDLKRLWIAPAILEQFDIDIIDRAFYLSTMNKNFPSGIKAIRGIVYDDYPDLFKIAPWTPNWIEEYVQEMDKQAGPLKRSDGVAIPTRARMTQTEQDMLLSMQMNPGRKDHEQVFTNVLEARNKDYDVIKDWELEAAKRVAWRYGVPLNAETRYWTDKEIRKAYDTYVADVSKPIQASMLPSGNIRYPSSIIAERKTLEEVNKKVYAAMANNSKAKGMLPADEAHVQELNQHARRTTQDRLARLQASSESVTVVVPIVERRQTHVQTLETIFIEDD